jgi:uncharacterized phiE125 gp8 family phage protein
MGVIDGAALAAATAEAKAYLRIEGTREDALVAGLVGSAAALCEAFTGRWLLVRAGSEMVPAGAAWRRLQAAPVRAILGADEVPVGGAPVPMPPDNYATDIDADDCGWVRVPGAGRRVRVRFEAGLAESWGELPESLRHGIVRLTAHLYTHRSEAGAEGPPAAVSAMWRPWRRIGIGGPVHV